MEMVTFLTPLLYPVGHFYLIFLRLSSFLRLPLPVSGHEAL